MSLKDFVLRRGSLAYWHSSTPTLTHMLQHHSGFRALPPWTVEDPSSPVVDVPVSPVANVFSSQEHRPSRNARAHRPTPFADEGVGVLLRARKKGREEETTGGRVRSLRTMYRQKKNDTQQREFFLMLHFTTQLLVVYGEPLPCQLAANRGTT